MTRRWHSLGNTSSAKLQELWKTMAVTFNAAASNPTDTKWRVLEPPTGTGKTQGLCVYAALTIANNRTSHSPLGILVVTRTIAQAEEIAKTIRELLSDPADDYKVQTKHSQNKLHVFTMQAAEVLVITHAAYTLALEGLTSERYGRWQDYTSWMHGQRSLTIIDEALSGVVEESRITADDIRFAMSFIDPVLRLRFTSQVQALEMVRDTLDSIAKFNATVEEADKAVSAQIVWREGHKGRLKFPQAFAMGPLREAMASIRYDLKVRKESAFERQRIADIVHRTLKSCEAVLTRWAYYYRKGAHDTFNSSQLLISASLPGPVVLDATASQNFLWQLLEARAEIAHVPAGTRSYRNVTIHVARASGLGKTKMREHGKRRLPRLLASLQTTVPSDSKVLLCLHKRIEHTALSFEPTFAKYSVAHWGAIDGRNDWNDHDTVVIFGLPYRDQIWATNTFFALKGLQDNRWLEQPSWGRYADVRREMQRRQLTVSVIQAINRVRCRRVIDAEGNCPPTDVFIVLPIGTDGDAMLDHLKEEMPGAVFEAWAFELDGPQERVRRGSSHEALLSFMGNRLPGETPMSLIQSELGLTPRTVKELRSVLRKDSHDLTKSLAEVGVRYLTSGMGRSSRSFLLKR